MLPFSIYAQEAKGIEGLVLRGKVLNVQVIKKDYVDINLKLSLDFVNESDEAIILLKPTGDEDEQNYIFWQFDTALAKTKEDAENERYIVSYPLLPSFYSIPNYSKLIKRLNKSAPPSTVTRILQPKEAWTWKTTALVRIAIKREIRNDLDYNLIWSEININTPLWVRVYYLMFPFNIENFRNEIGNNLQRRWKSYGRLWFDGYSPNESDFGIRITSEPIKVDLTKIKLPKL